MRVLRRNESTTYLLSLRPLPGQVEAAMTDSERVNTLTSAEVEVLILKCKGFSRREISRLRKVSATTVDKQLNSIYSKLEVGSSEESAVIAAKAGMV